MVPSVQIVVRIPSDLAARLDALLERRLPELDAVNEPSRSDVVRLALVLGVRALERKGKRRS